MGKGEGMYKKILVPLDGSEESEKALTTAQKMLQASEGGQLILLRVTEIPTSRSWTSSDVLRAKEEETKAVMGYLEEVKARLADPSIELIMHTGPSPAQVIADTAREQNADLIVMTSHGRSALHQFLLGSQTEKTLRMAPCSVLVVRGVP
jgi:nucleotide-binding universal stress UspA family protein